MPVVAWTSEVDFGEKWEGREREGPPLRLQEVAGLQLLANEWNKLS